MSIDTAIKIGVPMILAALVLTGNREGIVCFSTSVFGGYVLGRWF